jgi:FkbM family methyltransferase
MLESASSRRCTDSADVMSSDARTRIDMTCRCDDSRVLARVANAGAVETFQGRSVQVMHNGVRVLAGGYHGDWMVEVIRRLRGCHEPQEELVFWEVMKRLPQTAVMVELGAFWAYYSCWFLKDRPAGRVYCVEPDPNNVAVGRVNVEMNDAEAMFVEAAVGAASAPPEPFACESDGVTRSIPRISVDALVRDQQISRIDLLLSDIQGAETEMLQGCVDTLRSGKLRFLFVSTHHHSISRDPLTHQKCLAFIRDHGGHVFAEHTVAESFSGDGLIAASFAGADRSMAEIPLSRNRASTNIWRETEYDLAEALNRQAAPPSFRQALKEALRASQRAIRGRLQKGR